jgi:hypothetical protein
LREDTVAAPVLPIAVPRHHEVAAPVGGDGREVLDAGRVRVDPELEAPRGAGGVEALPEDAVTVSVLDIALPHHDEIAVGRRGHHPALAQLRPGGVRVHAELTAGGDLTPGRQRRNGEDGQNDGPATADGAPPDRDAGRIMHGHNFRSTKHFR